MPSNLHWGTLLDLGAALGELGFELLRFRWGEAPWRRQSLELWHLALWKVVLSAVSSPPQGLPYPSSAAGTFMFYHPVSSEGAGEDLLPVDFLNFFPLVPLYKHFYPIIFPRHPVHLFIPTVWGEVCPGRFPVSFVVCPN